jgi:hypothetical protein
MDVTTQYATGALAIIGLINGINFAVEQNWKSFVKFLCSVIIGIALGSFQWFGIPSAEVGLLLGLAASGAYKALQVL